MREGYIKMLAQLEIWGPWKPPPPPDPHVEMLQNSTLGLSSLFRYASLVGKFFFFSP